MDKPMSLRQIAGYVQGETPTARYMRAYRALRDGAFPNAYKVGVGTSMWLVPPGDVADWLGVDVPEVGDAG